MTTGNKFGELKNMTGNAGKINIPKQIVEYPIVSALFNLGLFNLGKRDV